MNTGFLEVAFPWALLLLPMGSGLFLLARGSAARLGPAHGKVALGLRCALFLCLVLALCDPRLTGQSAEKHVIWAVDVSDSVGGGAVDAAITFAGEANLPKAAQSWIAFAGEAMTLPGQPVVDDNIHAQNDATDLARALQFASANFPSGQSRVLVLFTDGVETVGHVLEEIRALVADGVKVFTVPVDPPDHPEVMVKSLRAPRQVRANEPFEIEAVLATNHPTTAQLEIFQDGLKAGAREVPLKEGMNPITVTQRLAGGRAVAISLRVTSPEDTLPENNRAEAVVVVEGEAPVLIVSENPSHELAGALALQGIEAETRSAAGVPDDPGTMQKFDAVVIDQVPSDRFTPAQLLALDRFVRDSGGGLLMLGGPHSFGAGGYAETPVGDLLPLMSEFQKQVEIPSLAIVPVIDRSGSMAGDKMRMAKAAAAGAVQILSPRDFAGVVVFDAAASWSPRISSAANPPDILRAIGAIEATGGTNLSAGLDLALQGLRGTPAKLKHVILLSDGISMPGPHEELAAQLAAENISLTTVALGGDADEVLLERLARIGNGRYYFTDSPESIPQIFARETLLASRPGIREEPFVAQVARPAPFLAGIDFDSSPFLLGYTITSLRPGADLWLMTEGGDPLLATWRVGLGKVAAFSSDARNVWASEWLQWESFGVFWSQVLREILRPKALREFPLDLRREQEGFRLTLETADPSGRALPGLGGRILLTRPDGSRQDIPLEPAGPGLLDGWWSASEPGTYHAAVQVAGPDGMAHTQYASVATGVSEEYLLHPTKLKLLEELAGETGGKLSPTPMEVASSTASAQPMPIELWPWLAGCALGLFLADVWAKKCRPPRRLL